MLWDSPSTWSQGWVRLPAIQTKADLQRLRNLEPPVDTPYVLETVKELVRNLDVPLIGFAGAFGRELSH